MRGTTVMRWCRRDYGLAVTLDSGQVFGWREVGSGWEGVVGGAWVRLEQAGDVLTARTAVPREDWRWLEEYLQLDVELGRVLGAFPPDPPLQAAVAACPGLRLLRQDPWECLASFILSSTKQITQIRQMVARLSERFGEPVVVPAGRSPACRFPTPERLAGCSEAELRACRVGFRAPYLREAACRVAAGQCCLEVLAGRPLADARAALMELPGVGRKIADCVLLFALGFGEVFPVDVWILRALRELYFAGRGCGLAELRAFSETHFGLQAGYAQQYLFHFMRRTRSRAAPALRRPGPCCA